MCGRPPTAKEPSSSPGSSSYRKKPARGHLDLSALDVFWAPRVPAPDETPFKIERAEDLLTLRDPDWLVRDAIQRNTLALIYGPSGCGTRVSSRSTVPITWRLGERGSAMKSISGQACSTSLPRHPAASSSV